jgi:ATP-dependent helicase/DNAse subunit B
MSDGMRHLVLLLRERAAELTGLANDADSLSTQWTSKDVEDFLIHRANVIKTEVEILQRQIQRLIKQS